jgi:hypothetical protein
MRIWAGWNFRKGHHYKNPDEIANDSELSAKKSKALETWEQDAREMLTARRGHGGQPASAKNR